MMFKAYLGYLLLLCFVGPVLLGPPMPTHGEQEIMCEKSALEGCLTKLHTFLRITSLPFTSEPKELDKLCEKALSGYNCSQLLYKSADCLSQKEKDMIPIFIPTAEFMYFMLCGDGHSGTGYLRDAFLSNSDCIIKNKDKMSCCARETAIPDIPVQKFLEESSKTLEQRVAMTCCPLSRYIQCTSAVAKDNCGDASLNFTTEYIRRAAGEQVDVVCQKLPDFPETDAATCPDPIKTCSGCVAIQQKNIFLTSFVLGFISIWISRRQIS